MQFYFKVLLGAMVMACTTALYAQFNFQGTITDISGKPLVGVNIIIKETILGTITDAEGKFELSTKFTPPFQLVISYIGYERKELTITPNTTQIDIQLTETSLLGKEVVVSSSRVEESILKSPVSIEKLNILDIKNAAVAEFYSAIKNMNGVDFSVQSINFQTINTRGFGENGNTRFVQLIDGIDNQAPGFNFSVGNVIGIGELDVESVELLPGASSALYGPNALQGILLMRSKSPFEYQGLDFYSKAGVNHIDQTDHATSLYSDIGIRYAKAFNNKWAFKINASWLRAEDWIGTDLRDISGEGIKYNKGSNRENNRTYDGVNVYGDFLIDVGTVADLASAELQNALAPIRILLPNGTNGAFTPTGYEEKDFVDNHTESIKLGTAIHYRFTDKLELLTQLNWGLGSSVHTASDRYILDNFGVWTGKLELRGDNFFLRGYTTQENAGDTYAANTLASLINANSYLESYLTGYIDYLTRQNNSGGNPELLKHPSNEYEKLHAAAKAIADDAQLQPGTVAFNEAVNDFRSRSISDGGTKLIDKSYLLHYEGSYNFKNQFNFANVIVGGNFRTYALNSNGTIFALDDAGQENTYSEFGGYLQAGKDITKKIKVQGSVRYDKNMNFKGQFSPRISSVWEFLNKQNLRASYQRGFRIPTSQDQYIDLDVISRRLIGRNPMITRRYNLDNNTVYTQESVLASQQSKNEANLQVADLVYNDFETEKVGTYEVGYKGLLFKGKLLVDAFYYNSLYKDFTAGVIVTQAVSSNNTSSAIPSGYETQKGVAHDPSLQSVFVQGGNEDINLQDYAVRINIDDDVRTYGYGLGIEYQVFDNFNLGGNASFNKIQTSEALASESYIISYNTPKWRYNLTIGNRYLTEKIGFGITYRWQDAYYWQSAIGKADIPDFATLDAQITYRIPTINGRLKLGGSNITNQRYTTSLANPSVGALYYLQLNLDDILNIL